MSTSATRTKKKMRHHGAAGGTAHDDDARRPAQTLPSHHRHRPRSSVPSHDVARGDMSLSSIRDRRQRLESDRLSGMDDAERGRFESYLSGGAERAHAARKRRAALREEDDDDDRRGAGESFEKRSDRERQRRRRRGPDRAHRARMEGLEHKRTEAAVAAADAELVLHAQSGGLIEAETDAERTYKLGQAELRRDHLDEQTARQIFDLKLDPRNGPYGYRYDRSGRRGLLYGGGRGGHVAVLDCRSLALQTEFYVHETVRDGAFLHNNTMFALAQKRNVYIYDDGGTEIHRLDDHEDVRRMQFLPHHWLLATVGRHGWLKYHDTSTGDLISRHRTKLGPCSVMAQNPSNAVVHLGHGNGTVTLWSPASSEYLVKVLCHRGSPVTCLSVDRSGRYMVTGGSDSTVRIWDLRTYRETHSYFTAGGPPTSLDVSQRGVLAVAHGCRTTFWSPEAMRVKVKDPYMSHAMNGCGPVETVRFRPFEDVCGAGHQAGISSMVVPGSGEPNLDTTEYNTDPFQDGKARREAEVRALMDKLSPDMIALDPDVVGTVEGSDPRRRLQRARDLQEEANRREEEEREGPRPREKKKMRGRSKIQKKLGRKKKNVVDAQVVKLRELREKEREEKARAKRKEAEGGDGGGNVRGSAKEEAPQALKRFFQ